MIDVGAGPPAPSSAGTPAPPGAGPATRSSAGPATEKSAGRVVGWLDVLAVVALLAATAVVVVAYDLARVERGTGYYAVFWAGMAPAYVVVLLQVLRQRAVPLWILLLGTVTFVPKFVMSPSHPIYFDETAHFQLLRHTLAHGALFQHTPLLPIGTGYPGLEAVAAGIELVTGMGAWHAATLTVLVAHCSIPLLVYACAREVARRRGAAGIAALVYMANPQFLYGDTQFAYESLALAFFMASVLCYLRCLRAEERDERLASGIASVVLGLACVVTHHLTTLALCGTLVVIGVLWRSPADAAGLPAPSGLWGAGQPAVGRAARRGGRHARRRTFGVARVAPPLVVTGAFVAWVAFVAPDTVGYLLPHVTEPLHSLAAFLRGARTTRLNGAATKVPATRAVFGGSTIPGYELAAAFAAPVVLGLCGLAAGVRWIRHAEVRRTASWVYVLALGYFVTLPLALFTGGAPSVHRSWATTFFGLGLMMAVLVDGASRRLLTGTGRLLMAVGLVVVLVGNTAAGSAADYRFPGPYEFGSDTRSVTAQTVAMATWFKDHVGTNVAVATDRYTALALTTWADARTPQSSGALPIAEFWYDTYPPGPSLLRAMRRDGVRYLVVDLRSALSTPAEANLFYAGEPAVVPAADLTRLSGWPWLHELYRSTDYEVFRIDFAQYQAWYPSHAGEH